MTAEQVLEYIHKNAKPGDFEFSSDFAGMNYIRASNEMCPICWVGARLGKNPSGLIESFRTVGDELGMSIADCVLVASAADNGFGYTHCVSFKPDESQAFRQRLLNACKLS